MTRAEDDDGQYLQPIQGNGLSHFSFMFQGFENMLIWYSTWLTHFAVMRSWFCYLFPWECDLIPYWTLCMDPITQSSRAGKIPSEFSRATLLSLFLEHWMSLMVQACTHLSCFSEDSKLWTWQRHTPSTFKTNLQSYAHQCWHQVRAFTAKGFYMSLGICLWPHCSPESLSLKCTSQTLIRPYFP